MRTCRQCHADAAPLCRGEAPPAALQPRPAGTGLRATSHGHAPRLTGPGHFSPVSGGNPVACPVRMETREALRRTSGVTGPNLGARHARPASPPGISRIGLDQPDGPRRPTGEESRRGTSRLDGRKTIDHGRTRASDRGGARLRPRVPTCSSPISPRRRTTPETARTGGGRRTQAVAGLPASSRGQLPLALIERGVARGSAGSTSSREQRLPTRCPSRTASGRSAPEAVRPGDADQPVRDVLADQVPPCRTSRPGAASSAPHLGAGVPAQSRTCWALRDQGRDRSRSPTAGPDARPRHPGQHDPHRGQCGPAHPLGRCPTHGFGKQSPLGRPAQPAELAPATASTSPRPRRAITGEIPARPAAPRCPDSGQPTRNGGSASSSSSRAAPASPPARRPSRADVPAPGRLARPRLALAAGRLLRGAVAPPCGRFPPTAPGRRRAAGAAPAVPWGSTARSTGTRRAAGAGGNGGDGSKVNRPGAGGTAGVVQIGGKVGDVRADGRSVCDRDGAARSNQTPL